jgi:hypothetical protein
MTKVLGTEREVSTLEAAVIDAVRQERGSLPPAPFELPAELPESAVPARQGARRAGRPNRWVILDRAWAERLGVQRDGGVYRLRSSELQRRLAALAPGRTCGGLPTHLRVRTPAPPAPPAGHQLS